jgi:hypothetical protein
MRETKPERTIGYVRKITRVLLDGTVVIAATARMPIDVSIERPQHLDASMHHEVAAFGSADQASNRGLPFLKLLLSLRQAGDVVAGRAESLVRAHPVAG